MRVKVDARFPNQYVRQVARLEKVTERGEVAERAPAMMTEDLADGCEQCPDVAPGVSAEEADVAEHRRLPMRGERQIGHRGPHRGHLAMGRAGIGVSDGEDSYRDPTAFETQDLVENEVLREPRPRLDDVPNHRSRRLATLLLIVPGHDSSSR